MKREIKFTSRYRDTYTVYPNYDFFNAFKKKYKEYSDYDNAYLKKIIVTLQENFTDLMIKNRDGIELPYGLGNIRIFSYRPTKDRKAKDYNLSAKLGTRVGFTNMNTDGLMMKIVYTNNYTRNPFLRHTIWSLSLADKLRDKASKYFRENYEDFTRIKDKRIGTYFIRNNGNY